MYGYLLDISRKAKSGRISTGEIKKQRISQTAIDMTNGTNRMTADEFRAYLRDGKASGVGNASSGNKKVRNAQKCERDGVQYDSRTERYMGDLLTMHGIAFELHKKYTVLEPFEYNGEKIQAITYALDFYLPDQDMVIDTKGVGTQQGTLRIKMLKRLFADLGRSTTIEIPRTQADCDALVARMIGNRSIDRNER